MHPIYCECRDKFTILCFLGTTEFLLRPFLFSLWKFFFPHTYEFLYVITRAINRNSCHAPGSKALGQVTCTLLIDLSNLSFSICAWCEALWMEQIEENCIIHPHEKRSDRKQNNFLGWSCIKKKKKSCRFSFAWYLSWTRIVERFFSNKKELQINN